MNEIEWEYATTTGPRKSWYDENVPPEGEGWELDPTRGKPGESWERFDYHEERYWRRPIRTEETPATEFKPGDRIVTVGGRLTRRGTVTEDRPLVGEYAALVPVLFDGYYSPEWIMATSLQLLPVKQLDKDEDGMAEYNQIMRELEGLA